jgi:sarcosine oxidase
MLYDVIVVGAGAMGSATAYHLAKRGCRVLVIEQFDLAHDRGSSHGGNRIIRLAYAEDPRYVPLLRRAYELWRELERVCGDDLLFITGGIDAGPENGAIVQGSLQSCREHRLPYEQLDAAELHRRFPGYEFPKGMIGVYQPDAGFVLAERSVLAHIAAAQALGAEVHGREKILRWDVTRGKVRVETDRGSYRAKKLVITAGAWSSKLVEPLAKLAVPERQVLLWTQPLHPERFQPAAFRVFNIEDIHGENRYYGTPIHGIPGFKFGKYHHLGQSVNPDRMDREPNADDERVLRAAIRRCFPDANGATLAMKTCLFTNSPDGNFILDLHPGFPQVSMAAGFSGHGFKFAPVIGEIMADLALHGTCTRFELDLFRLDRFSSPTGATARALRRS